jgi:hypothetical protein
MYAATSAGSWTPEEAIIATNVLSYLSLDNDLVINKDIGKARKKYNSLDNNTKEFLKWLNPEADYQQQPKSLGKKFIEWKISNDKTTKFIGLFFVTCLLAYSSFDSHIFMFVNSRPNILWLF